MALIINNLSKTFDDFTISINLTVEEGETLVLAGPSGCGKTTTLHLISGLLEADDGEIILNGKNITKMPPWERDIAMVFQDLALFPHLDAEKNIAYAQMIKGMKKDERRKIVEDNLLLVHLSGYEKRRVQTLSGGEKQRIAIARALASKPDCLLFDEPFSSLDTPLRRELRDHFLEIRKSMAIPCIFVTHDREEAAVTADRLAVMDKGTIIETGTPKDLFLFPKTKIAAEFFGFGQVFPCEIKSVCNEKILVQSSLGELEILNVKNPKTKNGFFFLPKDAVHFNEDKQKSAKYFTAIFKKAVYRGDSLSYELELPSKNILSVDADIRKNIPQKGEIVSLVIDQNLIQFVE
jgi:ABC-type Fe3+/spermidine/putrescine transport system ATPase subunit